MDSLHLLPAMPDSTPSPTDSDAQIRDFEQSLARLEAIVQRLEQGELGLEESLKQFEQGVQLAQACQGALNAAELKVEQLIEQNGLQQTLGFDETDE